MPGATPSPPKDLLNMHIQISQEDGSCSPGSAESRRQTDWKWCSIGEREGRDRKLRIRRVRCWEWARRGPL